LWGLNFTESGSHPLKEFRSAGSRDSGFNAVLRASIRRVKGRWDRSDKRKKVRMIDSSLDGLGNIRTTPTTSFNKRGELVKSSYTEGQTDGDLPTSNWGQKIHI